ncbi:alkene reductase [Enterovirga aerilata]|uniref:Alkene reductase n=1 Tax=Enterovirga aerilata TaxID=2730920 RepID=A0A849I888_9HYPH|nr:alkene reductase [Enterovirga sp. DB1703]NNM72270.1 alkene reductase [Enterovirga sp. DB1703]
MSDASPLFRPLQAGEITLANRIVMAPLTRNRAAPGTDAPRDINVEYYRQRASAGLIVSEGSQISRQGQGYVWTPGIYTDAQVAGWRKVTDAVHAAGGRIVIQLWHVGRVSHVSLQPDGAAPVAPSAIPARTRTYIESGFAEVSPPRELAIEEIPGIVRDFARAAERAREAGFDGVEIHGANGYLLDQFMKDGANRRTDAYGGSIENRARFTLEVAEAVAKAWSPGRVGIRLSPVTPANGIADSNPQPLFEHVARKLGEMKLAFVHVIEGATGGPRDNLPFDYAALREAFGGVYIANNGYTRELAIEAVRSGRADAIAFGKAFISNPDLVERLRIGAPLNAWDQTTFYGGDERGYTDYPTLAAAKAA